MTSEQTTAMQYLNTPVRQGDWSINIMLLSPTGGISDELTAIGKAVTSWNLYPSSIEQGPLYDSGRDYEDDEDGDDDSEEDSEPEDHDDGQDLLSAFIEPSEDDFADSEQEDGEHFTLELTHHIDGAVFKEMRLHNLTGHEPEEVPGADVVITINYKSHNPNNFLPMLVFQHVFIGHATTRIESSDTRRNEGRSPTSEPLLIVTDVDIFRHEMYADPEMMQTNLATWISEQYREGTH